MASATEDQTHRNTELIIKVLIYVQQTMETLSEFNQQLKTKFNIDLTLKETS